MYHLQIWTYDFEIVIQWEFAKAVCENVVKLNAQYQLSFIYFNKLECIWFSNYAFFERIHEYRAKPVSLSTVENTPGTTHCLSHNSFQRESTELSNVYIFELTPTASYYPDLQFHGFRWDDTER